MIQNLYLHYKGIAPYALVLFLCFHSLAIGIEAIPPEAQDSTSRLLRSAWQPITRPYISLTWQWQRWNLFAPDPLAETSDYTLDVLRDDEWQEVIHFTPETMPWWRKATLLKVLRTVTQDGRFQQSRVAFLRRFCEQQNFSAGERVRLRVRTVGVTNITLPRETTFGYVCSSSR